MSARRMINEEVGSYLAVGTGAGCGVASATGIARGSQAGAGGVGGVLGRHGSWLTDVGIRIIGGLSGLSEIKV